MFKETNKKKTFYSDLELLNRVHASVNKFCLTKQLKCVVDVVFALQMSCQYFTFLFLSD